MAEVTDEQVQEFFERTRQQYRDEQRPIPDFVEQVFQSPAYIAFTRDRLASRRDSGVTAKSPAMRLVSFLLSEDEQEELGEMVALWDTTVEGLLKLLPPGITPGSVDFENLSHDEPERWQEIETHINRLGSVLEDIRLMQIEQLMGGYAFPKSKLDWEWERYVSADLYESSEFRARFTQTIGQLLSHLGVPEKLPRKSTTKATTE